jgi:hypothetical protein
MVVVTLVTGPARRSARRAIEEENQTSEPRFLVLIPQRNGKGRKDDEQGTRR